MRASQMATICRPWRWALDSQWEDGCIALTAVCLLLSPLSRAALAQSGILLLSDDIDRSGYGGVYADIESERRIPFVRDFDDLNEFKIFFGSESHQAISGSQAVDFAQVTWFDTGGSTDADDFGATDWFVSRGAEALLLRDEFQTGIEGGVLGPHSWQSPDIPDVEPRFSLLASERAGHSFGLVRGVRLFQTSAQFRTTIEGGILGRTTMGTLVENHAIAPHVGIVWSKAWGPLTVELQGLALVGYNAGRVKLNGTLGEQLIPGALNRPLYARPTAFVQAQDYQTISSSGEIRAEGKLQLIRTVALRFVWSGVAMDNLLVGGDRILYRLPGMSLVDRGYGTELVHNLYCGIEVVR